MLHVSAGDGPLFEVAGERYSMAARSRVTIKDIAERLQLSTATISRALSGHGEHNDKTVALVKRTAKSMGYVRNMAASDLVQRQSHIIAVVMSSTKSNFGTDIVSSIEAKAAQHNLDVFVIHVGNSDSLAQQRAIRAAVERAVRGIALVSLELDEQTVRMLHDSGIPCVVLSAPVKDDALPFITSDNFKMGHDATEFLIERGHRRIGLAGIPDQGAVRLRIDGYRAAMKEHGLAVDRRWIQYGSCVYEDGVAAVDAFMHKAGTGTEDEAGGAGCGITAVLGASDLTAFGVMNRAAELGLDVPSDLSVMSFDGTELVDMMRPSLTSVTQDFTRMGCDGFDVLLGEEQGNFPHYVPFEIAERDSTAAVES